MNNLHNKYDKATLLRELEQEDFSRKTLSFYRYVKLDDLQTLRDTLYSEWQALKVLGRVYVANEGINAQISVPEHNIELFRSKLNQHRPFKDVFFKMAVEEGHSFIKLTIKVKHEIVAYRIPDSEYDMSMIGKHLSAHEFNQAIDDGAIVVDMRNQYEAEVGHFENAIIPDVDRSQELLSEAKRLLEGQEDKKILLYCTGGIRCEKASSYLMHHGFKDVNQLNGGIIQYAHEVKSSDDPSKFIGKNFVFDSRMGERITDDIISHCHQCDAPCDNHIDCANTLCHTLFIQCESCAQKYNHCCSQQCSDFMRLPKEQQVSLVKSGALKFTTRKNSRIATVTTRALDLETRLSE